MHMGIDLNPRMHTGISAMQSLYAYGDFQDPHVHTGIDIDPLMHKRIASQYSPYAYGD